MVAHLRKPESDPIATPEISELQAALAARGLPLPLGENGQVPVVESGEVVWADGGGEPATTADLGAVVLGAEPDNPLAPIVALVSQLLAANILFADDDDYFLPGGNIRDALISLSNDFYGLDALSESDAAIITNTWTFAVQMLASATAYGVGIPQIARSGDTNSGIHWPAADQLSLITGGSARFTAANALLTALVLLQLNAGIRGNDGSATVPTYSFTLDTNTGWFRYAVDTMDASAGGGSRLRIASQYLAAFARFELWGAKVEMSDIGLGLDAIYLDGGTPEVTLTSATVRAVMEVDCQVASGILNLPLSVACLRVLVINVGAETLIEGNSGVNVLPGESADFYFGANAGWMEV